ncbi:hypothetical protein DI270_007510 [Microbispora triticiradicis]|uniref:ADP-ribosylglycohydrolase family protein n=1 Tax=Microbispora triticiradicis TaxID=2200763 RepID=A0ABX9LPK6_9ACTN|nr:hypothetical protein DI270_007510 [Microbispora triticiradicis]
MPPGWPRAGPGLRLAERCGLAALVGEYLVTHNPDGVNAPVEVPAIVAGMVAGANSSEIWTCCAMAGWAQAAFI